MVCWRSRVYGGKGECKVRRGEEPRGIHAWLRAGAEVPVAGWSFLDNERAIFDYNVVKCPGLEATVARTDNARRRLIESAMRLIHAGSYGAVSVKDLCVDAGVGKGSFYHYFPSKRDLALAAMDADWEQYRTGLYEPAFAPDVPPLERITRYFRLVIPWAGGIAEPGMVIGCPFGNIGLEMATQDEVIREKVREVFGHITDYFARTVEDAYKAGDIGSVDAQAAGSRLLAYLEGLYVIAKVDNDLQVFARFGDAAVALITAGDAA
jgi:TetR/AcrR family transcriptional regulator, transcriptional repressor for nem operon